MKPRISLYVLMVILLLTSAACDASFTVPQGQGQAQKGPSDSLFFDDFSDPSSGWGVWTGGGAQVGYHNNSFRILVQDPSYDFWAVPGRDFGDVSVEVNTMKIGGPDDNDFGLICRYQNKDNFYLLVISSDGYYGIAKMLDGQYSVLGADGLQYNAAIAQGQASNHLQADCVGSTLRLYANGVKLAEVQDSDFERGDIGLIAGSYSTPGVDVLFDNVIVKEAK